MYTAELPFLSIVLSHAVAKAISFFETVVEALLEACLVCPQARS